MTGSSAGDVAALVANTNAGLASSASLGFGLWGTSGSGTGTTGYAAQISAVCANAANGNTDVAFNTYTGSAVAPNYTLVERMRISAAGNVGIGTTAPGTTLDVNGIARAISGFGTNSGSIIGVTTSGSIAHTFRGGIALLTAVGSSNVRYMGFVTWIGNVSSPFIDQIVSVSLTASINTGTLAISFATTAGTANIAWNITYLSCPTWSATTTFTPGF